MRVALDATKCEAFGACAEHCPSGFELDEWGFASLIGDGTVQACAQEAARKAIAACPEEAITATD